MVFPISRAFFDSVAIPYVVQLGFLNSILDKGSTCVSSMTKSFVNPASVTFNVVDIFASVFYHVLDVLWKGLI